MLKKDVIEPPSVITSSSDQSSKLFSPLNIKQEELIPSVDDDLFGDLEEPKEQSKESPLNEQSLQQPLSVFGSERGGRQQNLEGPRPVSSRLNPELDDLGLSSDEDDSNEEEEI